MSLDPPDRPERPRIDPDIGQIDDPVYLLRLAADYERQAHAIRLIALDSASDETSADADALDSAVAVARDRAHLIIRTRPWWREKVLRELTDPHMRAGVE
jgi:hypothetical protein